ncbi:septation ring formation regulator EzrA [Alkalibacillus almallahensis]|uniref:septation ring formation regulator EzrA n=1 Tax=Alkalibacillus almallahensis TaxID=1379154 RepID=UPI0014229478|nr:septation ring formation regulator EzrA [Alkalibacillus almallahensis]NIK11055.1 septation ring formation regulator [Alkalibacillus almallahensis]
MEYIIGIIILIIAFILVGVVARKKVYNKVDTLETWKVKLMNRQVADELGKVGHLNLTGETEELFETWRNEWDDINDHVFTEVEEYLLDAEEAAEKYKFGKASRSLKAVEQKLSRVEKTIDDIFDEVDRLLHSEQDSREEAEKLQPMISETRKKVLQNGYQLGKAEVVFEVELDELQQEMARYEELTTEGNYSDALELIHNVKARLNELNRKIETFPEWYRLCKHTLPEELDQLHNGLKEMKDDGYRVQHLGIEKEIQTHHETLLAVVEQLNKGKDDDVQEKIEQIQSRMVEIYDQLEKEAFDKNFVMQRYDLLDNKVEQAREAFNETKENVMIVKENYHLKDEKYEKQYELEKSLDQLEKKATRIKAMIEHEEQPYSTIRADLEGWMSDFEEWEVAHQQFSDHLYNLRKDELSAREKIDQLKQRISHVRQRLYKSNLPGVPNYIVDLINQATDLVEKANQSLNVQPLDVDEVSNTLEEADKNVERAVEQTDLLIEQAQLAEYVIQYANRYRSSYPVLAAKIAEAEEQFRHNDYELALEQVGTALEEIEPGAVKRIEEQLKVTAS